MKNDNKKLKEKKSIFCKITQKDKLKALTRLCTVR